VSKFSFPQIVMNIPQDKRMFGRMLFEFTRGVDSLWVQVDIQYIYTEYIRVYACLMSASKYPLGKAIVGGLLLIGVNEFSC
jgi:hypothetical protein